MLRLRFHRFGWITYLLRQIALISLAFIKSLFSLAYKYIPKGPFMEGAFWDILTYQPIMLTGPRFWYVAVLCWRDAG